MTRLRILSGRHAGVSIDWLSHRLVVGASEDLDVFIGDWNAAQIELQRDAHGQPQARWPADQGSVSVQGERPDGDDLVCPLEPWMPVRFGAVILCIGPADGEWPDDAELLSRCFVPPLPPAAPGLAVGRRRAPAGRRLMIAAVACCTVAATPSSIPRSVLSTAPARPDAVVRAAPAVAVPAPAAVASAPAVDPEQRLRAILGASVLDRLDLERQDNRIVLRGVLPSRSAVDALNQLLDARAADLTLSRRFVAAQAIVDRLHEAAPVDGLSVRHVQDQRFEVAGRVADPDRVQMALSQVAADLAEFGARIDIALQPVHDALPTMSGLLIDSQGTSFLRTRDGVKHIVVSATASSALRRPAAAPASTPLAPEAQEKPHATR